MQGPTSLNTQGSQCREVNKCPSFYSRRYMVCNICMHVYCKKFNVATYKYSKTIDYRDYAKWIGNGSP